MRIQIRIQIRGGGGRSAKNVHPPAKILGTPLATANQFLNRLYKAHLYGDKHCTVEIKWMGRGGAGHCVTSSGKNLRFSAGLQILRIHRRRSIAVLKNEMDYMWVLSILLKQAAFC